MAFWTGLSTGARWAIGIVTGIVILVATVSITAWAVSSSTPVQAQETQTETPTGEPEVIYVTATNEPAQPQVIVVTATNEQQILVVTATNEVSPTPTPTGDEPVTEGYRWECTTGDAVGDDEETVAFVVNLEGLWKPHTTSEAPALVGDIFVAVTTSSDAVVTEQMTWSHEVGEEEDGGSFPGNAFTTFLAIEGGHQEGNLQSPGGWSGVYYPGADKIDVVYETDLIEPIFVNRENSFRPNEAVFNIPLRWLRHNDGSSVNGDEPLSVTLAVVRTDPRTSSTGNDVLFDMESGERMMETTENVTFNGCRS